MQQQSLMHGHIRVHSTPHQPHLAHAADRNASGDEAHVAVIDEDGLIGGTKGAVLETFPFVSLANGALNADGSTNLY